MSLLGPDCPHALHTLGDLQLSYLRDAATGIVELRCWPTAHADRVVANREFDAGVAIDNLPARWRPVRAHEPEWLVQLKCADSVEPQGFQLGRSLRGSDDTLGLVLEDHSARDEGGERIIDTTLHAANGLRLTHRVRWRTGDAFFRVGVIAQNPTAAAITIEYLPSFSLGGLTPFAPDEAPERLRLHRFRTAWSAEGRHESALFEDLCLERSWIGYGRRTVRFGQLGSQPVRDFFPWAAVEDVAAGVFWGVQLSAPGSWHLEVARCKDKATLSGGLPSRDFGEWSRTLAPGESFATPEAVLTCVAGDLDTLCHALVSAQRDSAPARAALAPGPLPVIFNEWCSSWGEPTHDYVVETARVLAGRDLADILVIDDGWAEKPAGADIQTNGDWIVDRVKFPGGLRATTDAIRALGLVPGLWFEFESITRGCAAYADARLHLHRGGRPVEVGRRRFWDLRVAEARAVLAEKVIARLRDDGFGYWKIDYNETLPAGVDGPLSPGDNLAAHLEGVRDFIRLARREVPGLLIENCSSGGHRLEPSFQALAEMGSFSDAHETWSIPIIAANLHRLILPVQSQIWCVVHADDSLARVRYGLAATFLGRLCVSGDVKDLPEALLAELAAARAAHRGCAEVLRHGVSRLHRQLGASWNQPRGWQAVVRHTQDTVLVVAHVFGADASVDLAVPLPEGDWTPAGGYALPENLALTRDTLRAPGQPAFSAFVWLGRRAA